MSVRWWARRLWRYQPVDITSPLPVAAAADRLDAALYRRWGMDPRRGEPRSPTVRGRVRADRVRLFLAGDNSRNSWRPVLRARLEPHGAGCRLVGRIGTTRLVGWFTALWALLATVLTAVALLVGVAAAATRTASVATVVVVGLACLALDGGFAALSDRDHRVVAADTGELAARSGNCPMITAPAAR